MLLIDTVSQNRLNILKNQEIEHKFYKIVSGVLEVTPRNDTTLGSKNIYYG